MRTPGDAVVLAKGKRLLKEVLPRARARARKMEAGMEAMSGVGAATFPHARASNLLALVVYEDPPGCWHADLLLKKVPPGVPNSFGTPAAQPLASRERAVEVGVEILAGVLRSEMDRKEERVVDRRVFNLWNLEFEVPGSVLDSLSALPGADSVYGSEEEARGRLDELVGQLMPDGVSGPAYDALPRDAQARLLSVMALCLLHGVFRHPDPVSGFRH